MQPIHWTTLEFEPQDRHRDWNWYVGLVAVIAAILAFFYGDIFFGIFIIIAGATVLVYAHRAPRTLSVTIDDRGVSINDELVQYPAIKQFWLDETDKQDKLLLLVQGSFVPLIAIPLQGVSAETVREAMKPHTQEQELRESRATKLFERLGF